MAKQSFIVDNVEKISEPAEKKQKARVGPAVRYLTVSFEGGQTALLDMSIPRSRIWMDVLNSLREAKRPAYVELDGETNAIAELLCPEEFIVGSLSSREGESAVEVELIISHSRHYLRRDNPRFSEMMKTLQGAHKQKRAVLVNGLEPSEGEPRVAGLPGAGPPHGMWFGI